VTNFAWWLLQETKIDMSELQLKAPQLAEMVGLIEDGTISGKIAKQILPDLLQACAQLVYVRVSCDCNVTDAW